MIDDEKIIELFLSVPSKPYGSWTLNTEKSATTSRITS